MNTKDEHPEAANSKSNAIVLLLSILKLIIIKFTIDFINSDIMAQ